MTIAHYTDFQVHALKTQLSKATGKFNLKINITDYLNNLLVFSNVLQVILLIEKKKEL